MRRHSSHTTSSADNPPLSRRNFGRGVLLAVPAAAVIEQLATAPGADAAAASTWTLGGNAVAKAARLGTTTPHALILETTATERMRITGAGQIGIGTGVPAALVHVRNTGSVPAALIEQAGTGSSDGLTVQSATAEGGNAIGAFLTAQYPGDKSAAVYGYVPSGFDTEATAVWGSHNGSGRGVYGSVSDAGVGVAGKTYAFNGLAGFFENPSLGVSGQPGTAVRALAAGGGYGDLHPDGHYLNASGEFAGAIGVLGAATGGHAGASGVLGLGPNKYGAGVEGIAGAADAAGVYAYHPTTGAGVRGGAGGNGFGVQGDCNQTAGVGGQFLNRAATPGAGAQGFSGQGGGAEIRAAVSTAATNVFTAGGGFTDGYGGGEFVGRYGVVGVSDSQLHGGAGVLGVGSPGASGLVGYGTYGLQSTGTYIGVHAATNKQDGIALLATGAGGNGQNGAGIICNGDAHVTGILTKSGGSFRIDHPLDPANKFLSHSFVESPEMLNVYSGTATLDDAGKATVELPDWHEALNRDHRYQLTCLDAFAPVYVSERITNGRFSIAGGTKGLQVCWQVTGVRKDAWAEANRIPVESVKSAPDRGRYLNPELFGPRAELLRSFGSRQPDDARIG